MRQVYRLLPVLVLAAGCAIDVAANEKQKKPPSVEMSQSHEIYGTVKSVDAGGSKITLQTRDGRVIEVDITVAVQTHRSSIPPTGRGVNVRGTYDAKGVLHAETVNRAKDSPAGWPADR